MITDNTEIVGGVDVAKDVEERVKTTGVRGLDLEVARKLGVFQRIANLLCVTHATIMAGYRVYSGIEYMIEEIKARRNEIAREMNRFDAAVERFVNFWTKYYAVGASGKEVNYETENLYHRIMEWMQMPEEWQLGEPQRTDNSKDVAIRVNMPNDKVYTFYKTNVNQEITESKEEWGVFCYNISTNRHVCVNANMDKASAMMVAKRLSEENKEYIYTASIIRDVVEKRAEIAPFKVFKDGATIGKLTNIQKR